MDEILPNDSSSTNQNNPKKISFIILLILLILISLSTIIFLILSRQKGSESTNQEKNSSVKINPNIVKIDKIISEIKNPTTDSIKDLKPEVWRIQRDGILFGDGGDNNKVPGLYDIRDELKKGNNNTATEYLKGLFPRLANPLPMRDGKIEPYKSLSSQEIDKIDPQRIFFHKETVIGIISQARLRTALDLIVLYYSL